MPATGEILVINERQVLKSGGKLLAEVFSTAFCLLGQSLLFVFPPALVVQWAISCFKFGRLLFQAGIYPCLSGLVQGARFP